MDYSLIISNKRGDLGCQCVNAIRDYEATRGIGIARRPEQTASELDECRWNGIYAIQGDILLGGVLMPQEDDWVILCSGFVWPDYRGNGIYTAMLEKAEELAIYYGFSGIACWTYDFECPAIYERMGYTKGSVMRDSPKGNTNTHYYKFFGSAEADHQKRTGGRQ